VAKGPCTRRQKKLKTKVQKKVLFKKGATHIVKSIVKQWPIVAFVVNPPIESFESDDETLTSLANKTFST
jgi:hypothetical protein